MKYTADIVIVSDAKSKELHDLTWQTILSCVASEPALMLNIIVVERQDNINYDGYSTLHYKGEFNYNQCLNFGAAVGSADLIACCNNDLYFHSQWLSNMLPGFERFDSISPYCNYFNREHGVGVQLGICAHCKKINDRTFDTEGYIEGLRVAHEFNGWCFVIKRKAWHKIGVFNTDYDFLMSDNKVIKQYMQHNIRHAIYMYSLVDHIAKGNNTLRTMPPAWQRKQIDLLNKYFVNK